MSTVTVNPLPGGVEVSPIAVEKAQSWFNWQRSKTFLWGLFFIISIIALIAGNKILWGTFLILSILMLMF